MQTNDQGTTRPAAASSSTTPRHPLESAFTPAFLERVRRREASAVPGVDPSSTDLALEAHFAGPWDVERVPAGDGWLHAAVRRGESACRGGGARLACIERQEACLGAAAFAGVATPNRLSVNADKPSGRRSPLGHPIHDGCRHLGHLAPSLSACPESVRRFRPRSTRCAPWPPTRTRRRCSSRLSTRRPWPSSAGRSCAGWRQGGGSGEGDRTPARVQVPPGRVTVGSTGCYGQGLLQR